MLYGFRQGLWIIDLYKTFYMLKVSFNIIGFIIKNYNPIWFINFNKIFKMYIKNAALKCGEY
jgi:ribosomal protein S2